jgi:hypothetical protein
VVVPLLNQREPIEIVETALTIRGTQLGPGDRQP